MKLLIGFLVIGLSGCVQKRNVCEEEIRSVQECGKVNRDCEIPTCSFWEEAQKDCRLDGGGVYSMN